MRLKIWEWTFYPFSDFLTVNSRRASRSFLLFYSCFLECQRDLSYKKFTWAFSNWAYWSIWKMSGSCNWVLFDKFLIINGLFEACLHHCIETTFLSFFHLKPLCSLFFQRFSSCCVVSKFQKTKAHKMTSLTAVTSSFFVVFFFISLLVLGAKSNPLAENWDVDWSIPQEGIARQATFESTHLTPRETQVLRRVVDALERPYPQPTTYQKRRGNLWTGK